MSSTDSTQGLQIAFGSLRDTAAAEKVLQALLVEAREAGLQEEVLAEALFQCLLRHPLLLSSSVR